MQRTTMSGADGTSLYVKRGECEWMEWKKIRGNKAYEVGKEGGRKKEERQKKEEKR